MRYLLPLFCFFLSVVGKAQTDSVFLAIAPQDYPITADELPVFRTQVAVGTAAPGDAYDADLEFPEYEALTKSEIRLLKSHSFEAKEQPDAETYLSVSRKQGFLEVSFVPIVKREGKWMRITSVKIKPKAVDTAAQTRKLGTPAQKATSDRYAGTSVLNSGKWVKIRVAKEGIYELTADKLKDMGFSDISKVKVYGYGGRILPQTFTFEGDDALTDDLEEVPLYRKSGSVLFFAEGTERWEWDSSPYNATGMLRWRHRNNTYSSYSYYFVTEGTSPLSMQTETAATSTASALTYTTGHALYDKDAFFWYEGGTDMYDAYDFAEGNTHSFSLATPSVVEGGQSTVEIGFAASSTLSSTKANVSVGGSDLGTLTVGTYSSSTESAREVRSSFSTKALSDENTFAFTTTAGNNARLNFICVSYPRTLSAADDPYAFVPYATETTVPISVASANSNVELWHIGKAGTPSAKVPSTLSGTTLTATVESGERYVLVDVSKSYDAPDVVGSIENQNLHADKAVDMVIIVPASGKLTAQAERLQAKHQADGLSVKVVPADKIYNEFSSGTPDATAYRRYMKMLYDKADSEDEMPKYLLLFGDCAYDNRMITSAWKNYSTDDFLLAFEVGSTRTATSVSLGTLYSYVTDDYFGLLDDGEGANITREKIDVGIGRIPVLRAADAQIIVDKTLAYAENANVGAWKNRIVMLGDNGQSGENNMHMRSSEVVVSAIEKATDDLFHIKKYYWDAYTYTTSATGNTFPQVTKMLQEEMNRGALIFNYMGHGSPNQISHCALLSTSDFEATSLGNMPLWVFASCEITPFDTQDNNIGRATLTNTTGSLAVVCASRSVFANYNEDLDRYFCQNVLTQGSDGSYNTLGDAMLQTKQSLVSSGYDRTMNKLKYVLLGDPAIALLAPTADIVLDSIAGEALTSSSFLTLKAGQKVCLSGHIEKNGTTLDDFNGEITATLFDREETITCKNNGNVATSAFVYQDRSTSLFEGVDSVQNGTFSVYVVVPRDISYSTDAGRLLFYAVNNDHSLELHGKNEQFCLNGTDESAKTDTIGPDIYLYLDTPDFPDGGYVGTSALFGAIVSDSAGLNVSGISIGHDMELVLDGNTATPNVLNDYFTYDFGSTTSGTVAYDLTNLELGKHTLSFRAWDVNDNSSIAYLNFIVVEDPSTDWDVNATQNPATSSTTFITTLATNEACTVRTDVYDAQGRRIWTGSGSTAGANYFSMPWRCCDMSGRLVNAGVYIYRSTIETTDGTHETDGKKMIVIRQ